MCKKCNNSYTWCDECRTRMMAEPVPVPHKHADLIKAWADGAKIQCRTNSVCTWADIAGPSWSNDCDYRIKPEPKPDIVVNSIMEFKHKWKTPSLRCSWEGIECPAGYMHNLIGFHHIRYTFDGETEVLKSVELVK